MKKNKSILLLCMAFASMLFSSCYKDTFYYIRGTWEVADVSIKTTITGLPVWKVGDRMTFNDDGTGVLTVNGVSYNITYRAQQNNLTVTYDYVDLHTSSVKTASVMFIVTKIGNLNMTLEHSDNNGQSRFVLIKAD